MSAERRAQLVEVSQAHDLLIVADEVYHLLDFDTPPPPATGDACVVGAHRVAWLVLEDLCPWAPSRVDSWGDTDAADADARWCGAKWRRIQSVRVGHHAKHDRARSRRHLSRRTPPGVCRTNGVVVRGAPYGVCQCSLCRATWVATSCGFGYRLGRTRRVFGQRPRARVSYHAGSRFVGGDGFSDYVRLSFAHYEPPTLAEGVRAPRPRGCTVCGRSPSVAVMAAAAITFDRSRCDCSAASTISQEPACNSQTPSGTVAVSGSSPNVPIARRLQVDGRCGHVGPNHRLTQPWRFAVLGPEARASYGLALGNRKAKRPPTKPTPSASGPRRPRRIVPSRAW
jgi:hypothetical protein